MSVNTVSTSMTENQMKSLIIVFSYHHHNTEKIANVIAKELESQVFSPLAFNPEDLPQYDLIGFGSGIYSDSFHKAVLDFVNKSPSVFSKKAFLFSTDGSPRAFVKYAPEMVESQMRKNHRKIKELVEGKGYEIIGEFNCAGWNTNSFSKWFGGINKGRPNEEDLRYARVFAKKLKLKEGVKIAL